MVQAYEEACRRLSENLRRTRRKVGLSQEALALQAGINRSYVGQIERGVGNPSLQVLIKLASTLQLDVVDLLRREKDDKRR